jgi:serine protease AprX
MYKNHTAHVFVISCLLINSAVPAQQTSKIQGEYYNPYNVRVDSFNVVNVVSIDRSGESGTLEKIVIPSKNIYSAKIQGIKKSDTTITKAYSKISPVLQEWLRVKEPKDSVDIIINLQDSIKIPLLPGLKPGEKRESLKTKRAIAMDSLKQKITKSLYPTIKPVQQIGGFRILEYFHFIHAVSVRIRLDKIRDLEPLPEVIYMQPVKGGEKPPGTGSVKTVKDCRVLLSSDPYFNLGLTTPWIGLLDTGVRPTHALIRNSTDVDFKRDCVHGDIWCNDIGFEGYDPTDTYNHGTSSAAIITGNNSMGDDYRGVTAITLDSWKVYGSDNRLNSSAVLKGMYAAMRWSDRVIVANVQANVVEFDAIAEKADNMYDAGAIIVAANGTSTPIPGSVRSPAVAHKVLGVGCYDAANPTEISGEQQCYGPSTDDRFKPDIQAPTNSETASNCLDNALWVFGGTSGATPYAGAVAMLASNWLLRHGTFDNGQTYAFMILYGQTPYPYADETGAGKLKMATNGLALWGKVAVVNDLIIDIPICVCYNKIDLDGAIWWPEAASEPHNDVDLYLIDPEGVQRAFATSGPSIFERAKVDGDLILGTWILRVHGFNIQTAGQVVYWAAHVKNKF